jgi:hypothetical protein
MSWTITPQTKVPVDPFRSQVSLLLHGDGANGSTTITDSSPSPKTVIAVGNAQISTAQSKFGGSSIAFDGSGDYLTLPAGTSLAFGTGNFTVETWVYPVVSPVTYYLIDARNAAQTNAWALIKNGFSVEWFAGGASFTGFALNETNTWVHVAVSREGTSLRFFKDGVLTHTSTDSTNYSVSPTISYIASRFNATEQLNGYIDDLRITKGVARYTANFTPPAAPFPDI